MKNWIINLIIGGLALGIILIISLIAFNSTLTANESTLLSVLLTVLSIIGSWIVTMYFSKNSQKEAIEEVKIEHQNNLRTYALNAAEKVNNLSNELSKLAIYLRSELDQDDDSDEFALNSKIERIESAIHIVNTLKSVNDTSLSDWKGVIGDELEEREEEKEEREERLLELTEKIENILQNQNSNQKRESNEELTFIKRQLEQLGKTIGATSSLNIRTSSKKPQKEKVEKPCPNCDAPLSYTQRENIKGHKTVKCTYCGKRSLSRFKPESGFYLTKEQFISETFNCPWCNTVNEKEISNIPFTKEVISCTNCEDKIKVTRKLDMGLSVSTFGNSASAKPVEQAKNNVELTEELLDKVESALPKQPWPVAVHKIVAEDLKISNRTAYRSISELVNQGRCNPQINGIVYIKSDLKREDTDNTV